MNSQPEKKLRVRVVRGVPVGRRLVLIRDNRVLRPIRPRPSRVSA
jgi:hypothetical protein